MGKKKGFSALDRALDGDEEAVETVLGSVVAPLFDVAAHALGTEALAEERCAPILREIADQLRRKALAHPEPLVAALAAFWRGAAKDCPGKNAALEPECVRFTVAERRVALTWLAADLDGEELDFALAIESELRRELIDSIVHKLGGEVGEWRDRLNERAMIMMLPKGLLDFLEE